MKNSVEWDKVSKLLTVILPVYNSVNTIEKSINCLNKLRNNGVNILIGDNSSSDGTKEILKKYENIDNIHVFYQKDNIGAKNITNLLDQVTTEFVLPIGSDDYLMEYDQLPKTLDKINSCDSAVGCNFKSRFIYESFFVNDKTNIPLCGSQRERFRKFFLNVGANSRYYGIIRTNLFRKYHPDSFYFGFDVAISARILSHGNWLYDAKIILHRERGGSSNPFIINKSNGFLFIPPLRYFKECLKACSNPDILVRAACLYYYFKILIGPIKHLIRGK